jgi:hypothetical protein
MPVADGFSSWGMSVSLTEEDNEVNGVGVSLGNVGNYSLADTDGSEEVIEFKFDLSAIIADAGIQTRLNDLTGKEATLSDLVSDYLEGTFSYDEPTGVIVVAPENVEAIKLDAQLFLDSNQGFSVPVEALVKGMNLILQSSFILQFMAQLTCLLLVLLLRPPSPQKILQPSMGRLLKVKRWRVETMLLKYAEQQMSLLCMQRIYLETERF